MGLWVGGNPISVAAILASEQQPTPVGGFALIPVSGIVIQNVLARMNEVGYFGLGPDFKEGPFLAMALRDCLDLLAERMIDVYGVPGGDTERIEVADHLTAAIDTYKDALGITEELGRADETHPSGASTLRDTA